MIIRDPGFDANPPSNAQRPDDRMGDQTAAPNSEAALSDRQPKGDHNRRLALGLEVDDFAVEAGVTADELRDYESTWPDHEFDLEVAARVGAALDRLEANPPATQKVSNGPVA